MPIFTDFYCQANGNNTFAGSTTSANALCSGSNGLWDTTNKKYLGADNTFNTATSGMWCSIFTDGNTVTTYVGMIVELYGTSGVRLSPSNYLGSSPSSAPNGMSSRVGGAWSGPSGTITYPMTLLRAESVNSSGNMPRLNIKNDKIYAMTVGISITNNGPCMIQGYNTYPGDSGKAMLYGGTSGGSIQSLLINAIGWTVADIWVSGNGGTGGNGAFMVSSAGSKFVRCLAQTVRGVGFNLAVKSDAEECEAVNCNTSNTTIRAGFSLSQGSATRCISHHHNNGDNCHGFYIENNANLINCIADSCDGHGVQVGGAMFTGPVNIRNCDFVNNLRDGIRLDSVALGRIQITIENSNFIANSGYAIQPILYGNEYGNIQNCGFYGNTNGLHPNCDTYFQSNNVNYSQNPYTNSSAGNFNLSTDQAKSVGRGNFNQNLIYTEYTKGYPDIGASQALITSGGGGSSPPYSGVAKQRLMMGI